MTSFIQLSVDKYLSKHNLELYFKDAVLRMLLCKDSGIKIQPRKFLHEYFNSIGEGSHVLFREYAFVNACYRNRVSFVASFWSTFNHIGTQGNLLSVHQYFALVTIFCHDFDFHVLERTVQTILMEDAIDCVMSFADFIYTFQLQFIYSEFCRKCYEIFSQLQSNTSPSTIDFEKKILMKGSDSITSNILVQAIKQEIYNNNMIDFLSPPKYIVMSILSRVANITLYEFLMTLSKNDKLCQHIDILPLRPSSSLHC